jgi:hypothetical protein
MRTPAAQAHHSSCPGFKGNVVGGSALLVTKANVAELRADLRGENGAAIQGPTRTLLFGVVGGIGAITRIVVGRFECEHRRAQGPHSSCPGFKGNVVPVTGKL